MAVCKFRNYDVYYQLFGDKKLPCICFVNGLSMRTAHWIPMVEHLCSNGYSVLLFDMLGQGFSDKPVLDFSFEDNVHMLVEIMDAEEIKDAYVSGISYGGVVALKFPLMYPERTRGIIPISCFSEIDGHMYCHSMNLHKALSQVGFEYYVDYLLPLNFTSDWLEQHENILDFSRRIAVAGMEVYGVQNIMEKLAHLPSYTEEIAEIDCPTLIMNGEYDSLTTRKLHEIIRKQIKTSELVLVPNIAHAMTIENPDLCSQIIVDFLHSVEKGEWKGEQAVSIAMEEIGADPVKIPCTGNYLRMIPIDESMKDYKNKKKDAKPSAKPASKKAAQVEPQESKKLVVEQEIPGRKSKAELNLTAANMPKKTTAKKSPSTPSAGTQSSSSEQTENDATKNS